MTKIIDKNKEYNFHNNEYYVQLDNGKVLSLFGPDWAIERFATYENVCNRPYPVWIEQVSGKGWYFDNFNEWLKLDLSLIDFEVPLPLHNVKTEQVSKDFESTLDELFANEVRSELDKALLESLIASFKEKN